MNYIQGNSNISHTYHIYLDSDSGKKSGNVFQFPISPTIEVQFPQRGNLYLKEFSGINNLYNVNTNNQTNTISIAGVGHFTTGSGAVPVIPAHNYATLEDLVEVLNNTFTATTGVSFAVEGLKVRATTTGNAQVAFSGPLFEKMLRFTVDEELTLPHISKGEVDIFRATHNIYMSVAEVANNTRDVGTASGKGNRIAKIPVSTPFGAYVVYQAVEPVKNPL